MKIHDRRKIYAEIIKLHISLTFRLGTALCITVIFASVPPILIPVSFEKTIVDFAYVWLACLFLGTSTAIFIGPTATLLALSLRINLPISHVLSGLPGVIVVFFTLIFGIDWPQGRTTEITFLVGVFTIILIIILSAIFLIFFIYRNEIEMKMDTLINSILTTGPREVHPLQAKLPLEKQAPIIEIRADNKHLDIITHKGTHRIRHSMRSALEEFDSNSGILVHRKHWLRNEQISELKYVDGNPKVILTDGSERPASRKKVDEIRNVLTNSKNL